MAQLYLPTAVISWFIRHSGNAAGTHYPAGKLGCQHTEAVDFFLLDTNFFREATKSQQNRLLQALVPAVQKLGYPFGEAGMAIRLSPFSLLESLGVKPKKVAWPNIDSPIKNPQETYKSIFDYACAAYRAAPELQIGHLREKLKEQLTYVSAEARPLFDHCVTGVLKRDVVFIDVMASFLAEDFFQKYPFGRPDFLEMAPLLAVMFFMDIPEDCPTSRYRITKRMHDHLHGSNPEMFPSEDFIRAHKLKGDEDFLDTEIVQDVTFGFPFHGQRHRVVALTFDDAGVVTARAIMHRQTGQAMARKYTGQDFIDKFVRPYFDHPGGVIIQTNRSGEILQVVDLADVFSRTDAAGRETQDGQITS